MVSVGTNLKTSIWSVQPFLIGGGSLFWPCPLRRAHTTCTLVVDLGSPSPFLLCVAPRLYLITIFEVSIGTNSSTAITDKSVTVIPSSIHHCNFHLVNTTFCLLINALFAIPLWWWCLHSVFWLCESRSVNKPSFFAIHFLMVLPLFSFGCANREVSTSPLVVLWLMMVFQICSLSS